MNFQEITDRLFSENAGRYSVEVNYRTNFDELLEGFAKLVLGYVSAAVKNGGQHCKQVFDEKPFRIVCSPRPWEDGGWAIVVTYEPDHGGFHLSKGFFNKALKTVTVQNTKKIEGQSAAEIYREVAKELGEIKGKPPHHVGDLKGVNLKTGPKQGSRRPVQGLLNKGKPRPEFRDILGT